MEQEQGHPAHAEQPSCVFLQSAAKVKWMKRKQEAEMQPLMGILVIWKKRWTFCKRVSLTQKTADEKATVKTQYNNMMWLY